MGPKQTPGRGRGDQGKENWKRKRANNSTKDTPSRPGQSKKAKHLTTESPQNDSTESSKLDDSSIPTPADSTSLSIPTGDLTTTCDIISINIISSTQIQKKVTQTLELLSEYPKIPPAKSKVVLLHAKAPATSKMITIAEIAKREIAKGGGKWFQYNTVEEVMVEQKEASTKVTNEKENRENEDDDDETTAFETMKTPFERANEGKPKVRAVPVMTLYLSRVRIESLRKSYGEQTNALVIR